jgi:putative inorganic carbon (HCO3(-)) transporter
VIYYGLLLFFVLEYVRPGTYFPPINWVRLNTFAPLLVVLASALGQSKIAKPKVLPELNAKIFLFLLALMVVTAPFAEVRPFALEVFTMVVGYSLIFWVLSRELTTLNQMKGVIWILIFVHLVLAVCTPQMFLDPSTRYYIPAATFLGDGNDYALSINIVVPLCLFLLLDAKGRAVKIAIGVAFGVLLFAVIATQSRGGTLGLGAVAVYYWMKSDRKLVTGALAAVALVGILALAPGKYFERMNSISTYETDGSAQGRLSAWRSGTRMALFNPLGVGAGQFPPNFKRYATQGEVGWKTAHSIYFLILGELGFLGLAALLFYIVSNLAVNRRVLRSLKGSTSPAAVSSKRMVAALSASVLAYAVAGAFLSATYYPHMFVLAGLMVAARRIARAAESGQATPKPATPTMTIHPALRATLGGRRAS